MFSIGDKVKTDHSCKFEGLKNKRVYTIIAVSTWGECIDVPGYSDHTPAYQLDDGAWMHAQYMRKVE